MSVSTTEQPGLLSTRRIVIAGVLGAIAIALGVTRLGFIPVPNISGNATIMHIPAILGAVLEGPVVGVVAGGIFGFFSWTQADVPLFANPIIAIGPRLLIGLLAWLAYRSLLPVNKTLAAAIAGAVGTLTNTVGVIGLGIAFGLMTPEVIPLILPQAVLEVLIAMVLTPLVQRGIDLVRSGQTSAKETEPRDKMHY
ncbi:MAG TPA: ECF transporter S component [Roseiflexaceae bacterium]|nr:ECF transporter S component [Roseiflexaceae bacterium]